MIGYRNPVVPGFHPDPSVCRVGDRYVMAVSSFTYFPGVPILTSSDLVTWTTVGHALDRPSQLDLSTTEANTSAGIMAPTLRYHDGRLWMITTLVGERDGAMFADSFFVTAEDPAGPWSEPVPVPIFGIDPGRPLRRPRSDPPRYRAARRHVRGARRPRRPLPVDGGRGWVHRPGRRVLRDRGDRGVRLVRAHRPRRAVARPCPADDPSRGARRVWRRGTVIPDTHVSASAESASEFAPGVTVELPKIISVDDHVVEPPHVWQTWLPKKYREKGPRVERKRWGAFRLRKGAKYEMTEDPEGEWGDAWIYEDKVIYVQKKFVAIPKAATPGDDVSKFDKTVMTMTAITYDDMRPGCYDAKERKKDFELNWVDGSLPFPTFPRFCGQTFYEADDKELALACVQAYNDWMVEEWCDPSIGLNIPLCIIPLWDVELAAKEIERNAARGVRAVCFSELPTRLDLPSIHTGYWDPMFAVCNDTGTTVCMHVGSSSTDPFSSKDAPPGVGSMVAFNNSMASLGDYLFGGIMHRFPKLKIAYSEGQIGWIPYALERADTVWEEHNAWQHSKRLCPEPPSTYYYGRVFGCFTWDRHGVRSLDEVGEHNVCFETDYPHTDTTWPNTKEYCEKILADLTDEQKYDILRGNAIRMLELDRV